MGRALEEQSDIRWDGALGVVLLDTVLGTGSGKMTDRALD